MLLFAMMWVQLEGFLMADSKECHNARDLGFDPESQTGWVRPEIITL